MQKTMIAVPCMDYVHADFFRSCLSLNPVGYTEFFISAASLVYDARNQLAKMAIDKGFDRVLWLDSDMLFDPDLIARLNARIDEGAEYVSAFYIRRKPPFHPVIYKELTIEKIGEREYLPKAEAYLDYPQDSYFEIAASGFGAVMMTTEVIRRIAERFGLPFSPILGFGEDLSFCKRAGELGIKMYCDSNIKLGHIGSSVFTEQIYRETKGNG